MHKRIQFFILFSIFFCALCLNCSAAEYMYGDADNDKMITASDAVAVLQYTLSGDWADIVPVEYCDVDADKMITASDAADILQKSLKEDFVFAIEKNDPFNIKLETTDSSGDIYLTNGKNIISISTVSAVNSSKKVGFTSVNAKDKVLIFGGLEDKETNELVKRFIAEPIGEYADVDVFFTDVSDGKSSVSDYVDDLDPDYDSGVLFCAYSKTAADVEKAYRALMEKENTSSPFVAVIDENNDIKLVSYGSKGVYEAVKALVTGSGEVLTTAPVTTKEATTETTTQAVTQATTGNPFPNIRSLITEGKRLRDENIDDAGVEIWLSAVEAYNESKSSNANYSYINNAIYYSRRNSPEQYYNKLIGMLESMRFEVNEEELPDIISEGYNQISLDEIDDSTYKWLADANAFNEKFSDLSTYDSLNALLFRAMTGSSPKDSFVKITEQLEKAYLELNPELSTEITTETTTQAVTETTTMAAETTTSSPDKTLNVGGNSFFIGQAEKELPDAPRVEQGVEGCDWYIYNSDYHHYTQVGVDNGVVKCIYTMSEDLKYRNLKYNDDVSGLNLKEDPKYFYYKYGTYDEVDSYLYFDGNDGNRLYGIMLVSSDYTLKEIYTEKTIQNAKNEIFDMINAFRARNGVDPVKYDKQLEAVAQAHSDYMSENHIFSHIGSGGSKIGRRLDDAGIYFNYACENIAIGDVWPTGVTLGWINSYGHRSNMLKTLEIVGVGITYKSGSYFVDDDGYRYNAEIAYVENFVHVD